MASGVSPELAHEARKVENARRAMLDVVRAAAAYPCVVYGRCGDVVLASHPGAVHARIWAPADWRSTHIAAVRHIGRARARCAVALEDRRRHRVHTWLAKRPLDADAFHVVCDARRLGHEAIVDLLLAAGGVARPEPMTVTMPAARSGSAGRSLSGHTRL
jgi:Cytidylate kinase-like family